MHGVVWGELGRRLWPPAVLSLDQMPFPVIPVISACLSNALPTSDSDDAFAFE